MQVINGTLMKRVVNLVRAVGQIGMLLPGEKLKLPGEKPAVYLGAWEQGDLQVEYIQLHAFRLYDGVHVILESPSLNRSLGKYLL